MNPHIRYQCPVCRGAIGNMNSLCFCSVYGCFSRLPRAKQAECLEEIVNYSHPSYKPPDGWESLIKPMRPPLWLVGGSGEGK